MDRGGGPNLELQTLWETLHQKMRRKEMGEDIQFLLLSSVHTYTHVNID